VLTTACRSSWGLPRQRSPDITTFGPARGARAELLQGELGFLSGVACFDVTRSDPRAYRLAFRQGSVRGWTLQTARNPAYPRRRRWHIERAPCSNYVPVPS
jgi:hypothetical protein